MYFGGRSYDFRGFMSYFGGAHINFKRARYTIETGQNWLVNSPNSRLNFSDIEAARWGY